MSEIWKIAVDAPLEEPLSYESELGLKAGLHVKVPLGRGARKVSGVVLSQETKTPEFKMKKISSIEEHPRLPDHYIQWAKWLAKYYFHPIGQVLDLAYPPLPKSKKPRKSKKAAIIPDVAKKDPPELNEEQKKVYFDISKKTDFACHLLYGITGSGKTEVYLQLFQDCILQGKQGIFLLPEISLTPQLIRRFAERFGDQIAVIHSHLTEREKTNQWWDMLEKKKQILIGARSALFCPIENLGMIVVDEEHETSYKQDEKLKYNARDAAIVLAQKANCPVILGSATPSLETWQNAQSGKYLLHKITKRAKQAELPEMQVIDLKTNPIDKDHYWLSEELKSEIQNCLDEKKQVALFLNRRGMAQSYICQSCSFVYECPNCAVSLTLHAKNHLVCHYCGYHENKPDTCRSCGSDSLVPLGIGTESIENDLKKLFPEARIARADRDEILNREAMEDLIEAMENQEIDILLGTQMIAKGLDFPHLKLVALILADISFHLPDFRASEKSFQLITQMSGRAGRDQNRGKVLIQTYNAEHPSIEYSLANDFESFAKNEFEMRSELNYPPFGKLASIRMQALDLYKLQSISQEFGEAAESLQKTSTEFQSLQILGPAEAPLFKLRGKFRFQLLLKAKDYPSLGNFVYNLMSHTKDLQKQVQFRVDMDPLNML